MRRRHGGTGLHSLSTCGNEATARRRGLFPRCASCGNAGSVQAVALRLKINRECRRARDRASPRGAWPPHSPYAGRLGAWNTTRPVQQGFPCAASPIIGSDCEAPLPSASEPCRFTTINQECPTTHAFSCNRRATYLRFCKRRTHGARGSPIRRSKPAWF